MLLLLLGIETGGVFGEDGGSMFDIIVKMNTYKYFVFVELL